MSPELVTFNLPPPPPLSRLPRTGVFQVSLRFADAETLDKVLGVVQGAVSPLAVVNDFQGLATLAMDKDLIDASDLLVHPLRNDRSVRLKAQDLVKVVLGFRSCTFAFSSGESNEFING